MLDRNSAINLIVQVYEIPDTTIKLLFKCLTVHFKRFDLVRLLRVLQQPIFHMVTHAKMLLLYLNQLFFWKVN